MELLPSLLLPAPLLEQHTFSLWRLSPLWPPSGTRALFPLRTYLLLFPGCLVGSGHCLEHLLTALPKFNLQAPPYSIREIRNVKHMGYVSARNPSSLSLFHFQFPKHMGWHYSFVFNGCLGMSKSDQLLSFHVQWVSLIRPTPFQQIWSKYLFTFPLLNPIYTLLSY